VVRYPSAHHAVSATSSNSLDLHHPNCESYEADAFSANGGSKSAKRKKKDLHVDERYPYKGRVSLFAIGFSTKVADRNIMRRMLGKRVSCQRHESSVPRAAHVKEKGLVIQCPATDSSCQRMQEQASRQARDPRSPRVCSSTPRTAIEPVAVVRASTLRLRVWSRGRRSPIYLRLR